MEEGALASPQQYPFERERERESEGERESSFV